MKKISIMIGVVALLLAGGLIYKEYNPSLVKPHPHWTYAGEKNVFEWGEEEASTLCKIGKSQSPINVPKEAQPGQSAYTFHYTETTFKGENNGHTIQYTPAEGSENSLELNGEVYQLVQFHFHNPSEHEVGGVLYPMEVHFVHKSASGKLAVVGVMIEANDTPTMSGYWKADDKAAITKSINLSDVVKGGGKHYTGSLTTPPCSEGVEWLVLDGHQTMTQTEILEYRKILGSETNRPVEPVNGREVTQV